MEPTGWVRAGAYRVKVDISSLFSPLLCLALVVLCTSVVRRSGVVEWLLPHIDAGRVGFAGPSWAFRLRVRGSQEDTSF